MLAYESVQPDNEGDEAMPNPVKATVEIVDMSTFFIFDRVEFQPTDVLVNGRPIDRGDDGRWGGEVRE